MHEEIGRWLVAEVVRLGPRWSEKNRGGSIGLMGTVAGAVAEKNSSRE